MLLATTVRADTLGRVDEFVRAEMARVRLGVAPDGKLSALSIAPE